MFHCGRLIRWSVAVVRWLYNCGRNTIFPNTFIAKTWFAFCITGTLQDDLPLTRRWISEKPVMWIFGVLSALAPISFWTMSRSDSHLRRHDAHVTSLHCPFPEVVSCYWTHANRMGSIKLITCVTSVFHDDVIKWKHFPCYWPFVR